jgi:hypothetical protein
MCNWVSNISQSFLIPFYKFKYFMLWSKGDLNARRALKYKPSNNRFYIFLFCHIILKLTNNPE